MAAGDRGNDLAKAHHLHWCPLLLCSYSVHFESEDVREQFLGAVLGALEGPHAGALGLAAHRVHTATGPHPMPTARSDTLSCTCVSLCSPVTPSRVSLSQVQGRVSLADHLGYRQADFPATALHGTNGSNTNGAGGSSSRHGSAASAAGAASPQVAIARVQALLSQVRELQRECDALQRKT